MPDLPRLLAKMLKWPLFIASVLLLYWSVIWVSATYHLKWLQFRGKRNDIYAWAAGMKAFWRYKVLKVGDQELLREKCVYLCNHRSWADFSVDQFVTEGRSLFMGRWAVAAAFPTFLLAMKVIRSVILFKRGSIADKDAFNAWIDREFEASPQQALSVYPEGHRSTHGESLPLKRGMLHYTFSRKLPVQIVIGANKEAILSEKHHTARLNQVVAVGFSEVIRSDKYKTFDEFMAKVQQVWDDHWDTVYNANWDELKDMPPARIDNEYPLELSVGMFFSVLINWVYFAVVMLYSFKALRWFFGLFGPAQPLMVVLAALYVVASFAAYSRPVDALAVHGRRRKPSADAMAARTENDLSYGYLNELTAKPRGEDKKAA